MNKFSINYSGGSGGFLFYFSLRMALGHDVQDLIRQNWNIKSYETWKDTETIDNNEEVKLYCNNDFCYGAHDTLKICVYTDIQMQVQLARLKRALWFYDYDNSWMIDSYNNIKDDSWPIIKTIDELNSLSATIKRELSSTFHIVPSYRAQDYDDIMLYEGREVYSGAYKLISTADEVFYLQDVVRTEFGCVVDKFGLSYNDDIKNHIRMWVKLHPENIQQQLIG